MEEVVEGREVVDLWEVEEGECLVEEEEVEDLFGGNERADAYCEHEEEYSEDVGVGGSEGGAGTE